QDDGLVAVRQGRKQRDAAKQDEDRRAEHRRDRDSGDPRPRGMSLEAWRIRMHEERGDDAKRSDGPARPGRRGAPDETRGDERKANGQGEIRYPGWNVDGEEITGRAVASDERQSAQREERRDHRANRPGQ